MARSSCEHYPANAIITFDVGNSNNSVYELCEDCRKLPAFNENILSIQELQN